MVGSLRVAFDDHGRSPWTIVEGPSRIAAVALHNGHDLRPAVAARAGIDGSDRQREEDPHTDRLTEVTPARVVVDRSRFEVDLNRPIEEALCLAPDDCWGLDLWTEPPTRELIEGSRHLHAAFYSEMERVLGRIQERFERFVVLDIHSFNHRRGGPDAPPDDPAVNPDVNVGTRSVDRSLWGSLIDRFIADLSAHPLGLDVRENVKFKGRHFAAWIHRTWPDRGCCLALEFKKTFMDEWTGRLDASRLEDLRAALESTIPGLEDELIRA